MVFLPLSELFLLHLYTCLDGMGGTTGARVFYLFLLVNTGCLIAYMLLNAGKTARKINLEGMSENMKVGHLLYTILLLLLTERILLDFILQLVHQLGYFYPNVCVMYPWPSFHRQEQITFSCDEQTMTHHGMKSKHVKMVNPSLGPHSKWRNDERELSSK